MDSDIWGIFGVILIIAGGIYIFYTSNKKKKEWSTISSEQQKVSFPLRLQASERMILFLERIKPGSLLTRINTDGMNTMELQQVILREIRSEFEHNAAQQLYLHKETWNKISAAATATSASMVHAIAQSGATKSAKEAVIYLLQNEDITTARLVEEAIDAVKGDVQRKF